MSETIQISGFAGFKAWLLSPAPASRSQARWGSIYRAWRSFLKNRLAAWSLFLILFLVAAALLAPLLQTHSPILQDLPNRLAPPSLEHWLGTDELGRDLYSRMLHGGRVTLGMVVAVVILVAPVGLIVGTIAGYTGGITDRILMRIADIFLAFPRLVLALAFAAALQPGVMSGIIAIALTSWPPFALLARAETLSVRNSDFIAAVRLTGASHSRIVLCHIVPCCLSSLAVRIALDMGAIITTAAGLGFLGMGAQPPSPEWGTMIATSRAFIFDQWWVPTIPGITILLTCLSFNLVADGLRSVLDPKQDA